MSAGPDPFNALGIAHSNRFRRVSNRYPHQVALAYGLDIARATGDSDEVVAATVAAWEAATGQPVRDWVAFGAAEREDDGWDEG